jgi:hypothetical protein
MGDLCPTRYIISLLSDNTTALSWMHVAARTINPELQQLARFASALLVQATRLLTCVQPSHIPGILNDEADTISRQSKDGRIPSWEHVMLQHSQLAKCRICLLPPRLAAINTSVTSFLIQDRGHIRLGNDGSADSQFVFFSHWLDAMQSDQQSAAALTEAQTLQLLGAYLHDLHHGKNLLKSTALSDQTLRLYIASAANVFTILTNRRCVAQDPVTMHQKQPSLHPFLCEQLIQRTNWKKPRAKIEPYLLQSCLTRCISRFKRPRIRLVHLSVCCSF